MALYEADADLRCIESVSVDVGSNEERFQAVADFCDKYPQIKVIGHRFVHGGNLYRQPTLVDDKVLANLNELAGLAPLHNPPAIQGLKAARKLYPQAAHVLVFDTAFHSSLDAAHYTYPLSQDFNKRGFRRWGFHGISYQWSLERTAQLLGQEADKLCLLVCHLGGGASICAIKNGTSFDTTMGFTPMEGLMMSSRSGSIDPGIILRLQKDFSPEELDHGLNKESGLLGVSGLSSDMRVIEAAMQNNEQAALAHSMYIVSLRKHIFAMAAGLERLDALVFTGGIGFWGSKVREAVCRPNLLGFALDEECNKNGHGDRLISQEGSPYRIFCIEAKEELMIGRACLPFL